MLFICLHVCACPPVTRVYMSVCVHLLHLCLHACASTFYICVYMPACVHLLHMCLHACVCPPVTYVFTCLCACPPVTYMFMCPCVSTCFVTHAFTHLCVQFYASSCRDCVTTAPVTSRCRSLTVALKHRNSSQRTVYQCLTETSQEREIQPRRKKE